MNYFTRCKIKVAELPNKYRQKNQISTARSFKADSKKHFTLSIATFMFTEKALFLWQNLYWVFSAMQPGDSWESPKVRLDQSQSSSVQNFMLVIYIKLCLKAQ